MKRYHLNLGRKRTTVSVSDTLSQLMALKLKLEPETKEAHTGIREWLQDRLDEHNDPGRIAVSQWLQDEAVLFLVDTKLSEKYSEWILSQI